MSAEVISFESSLRDLQLSVYRLRAGNGIYEDDMTPSGVAIESLIEG